MHENRLAPWLSSLAERGDSTALKLARGRGICDRVSYSELDEQSKAFAEGFAQKGLRPGDRVGIWLPNGPMWMALHFGAARAGLTTIPLNTWYRESEIEHFLGLGNVVLVILDSGFHGIDFAGILQSVLARGNCPGVRWIVDMAGQLDSLGNVQTVDLDYFRQIAPAERPALPENEAMIAFSTSGTTAMPKLAVHREGALISHGCAVARLARIEPGDVVLGLLPPCGAYGYTLLLASLAAGARTIQLERVDVDLLVETIEREQVNVMAVTEPIIRSLLDHPQATPSSLRSLRIVFSAGGTLRSVVERAESEFGFRVTNVYGSSEVLALAAFWGREEDVTERSAAGGELVSDGMKVSVVDSAGKTLGPEEPGELRFKGPVLTTGYLENREATKAAFTGDGWFLSNDLGHLVEGQPRQFRYVARMNDALRLKGFLVNPGEIEARLQTHLAVLAAQVVGIPDGKGEDRAIAYVTIRKGASVSEEELRLFCRMNMASYKVPAAIKLIDAFPTTRSANGDKVVKQKLRELAQELEIE